MRHESRWTSFGLAALTGVIACGAAFADADLKQKMTDPANWAIQAGDYANHRWSDLRQINAANVDQLQVAWTLSTGVLRGHEGSPLVLGDTIYIHTPFPNNVYAVSLKDQTFQWKYEPKQDADVIPVMCCDTVSLWTGWSVGPDSDLLFDPAKTKPGPTAGWRRLARTHRSSVGKASNGSLEADPRGAGTPTIRS